MRLEGTMSSPLANVIKYKRKVVDTLLADQLFMDILLEKKGVDLADGTVIKRAREFVFEHNYVADTVTVAGLYVTVLVRVDYDGSKIAAFELELLFDLSKTMAKSTVAAPGNRLDNAMLAADAAIRKNANLGIGSPAFTSGPIAAPDKFTSARILYKLHDFTCIEGCK